jgi:DNA gyrase/topoisomerase IV subunit B
VEQVGFLLLLAACQHVNNHAGAILFMANNPDSTEEKNAPSSGAIQGNYGSAQLGKLEGLEAVRKKPGMYIGGTDERALHHCVSEVLDNSVDEHLAGHCDKIEVTIHMDGSLSVRDNGRGIPVDIHPQYKIPGVEMVLTTLHSGGKYGQGGYKFSGGTHGVGAKCVNAVSNGLKWKCRATAKCITWNLSAARPSRNFTSSAKRKAPARSSRSSPTRKFSATRSNSSRPSFRSGCASWRF